MELCLFLNHHIKLKKTVQQSSEATIMEIAKIWQKARIPMSLSTKRLMVRAMREEDPTPSHAKKLTVPLKCFQGKKLEDFMIRKFIALFELMELPYGFLQVDPDMWEDHKDFKHFRQPRETVCAMQVVNDIAERGIALIQQFSGLLTKNEPQLQLLLQIVEEHSQAYPNSKKCTLTGQIKQ
jgi:hypothetical protein